MRIQKPVKHLKTLTAFSHFRKTLHLICLAGSEYASGLLKLISRGCKRDTREGWYMLS